MVDLVSHPRSFYHADLILHDEDDDRQCNRIRLDGGLESHDMVFGLALLAGLEAVAFCYATRRIGFAPR